MKYQLFRLIRLTGLFVLGTCISSCVIIPAGTQMPVDSKGTPITASSSQCRSAPRVPQRPVPPPPLIHEPGEKDDYTAQLEETAHSLATYAAALRAFISDERSITRTLLQQHETNCH